MAGDARGIGWVPGDMLAERAHLAGRQDEVGELSPVLVDHAEEGRIDAEEEADLQFGIGVRDHNPVHEVAIEQGFDLR